jgi:hypothetical protein
MSEIAANGDTLRASYQLQKEEEGGSKEATTSRHTIDEWRLAIVQAAAYESTNPMIQQQQQQQQRKSLHDQKRNSTLGGVKSEQHSFMTTTSDDANASASADKNIVEKDNFSALNSDGIEMKDVQSHFYNRTLNDFNGHRSGGEGGNNMDDSADIPRNMHIVLVLFGVQLYNHTKYYNKNGTKKKGLFQKYKEEDDEDTGGGGGGGTDVEAQSGIPITSGNVKQGGSSSSNSSSSSLKVMLSNMDVQFLLSWCFMIFIRSVIIIGCILSLFDNVRTHTQLTHNIIHDHTSLIQ